MVGRLAVCVGAGCWRSEASSCVGLFSVTSRNTVGPAIRYRAAETVDAGDAAERGKARDVWASSTVSGPAVRHSVLVLAG